MIFEMQFPMLFYVCLGSTRNGRRSLKLNGKSDVIPLVTQDGEKHYDERYDTPKSRVDETSFMVLMPQKQHQHCD